MKAFFTFELQHDGISVVNFSELFQIHFSEGKVNVQGQWSETDTIEFHILSFFGSNLMWFTFYQQIGKNNIPEEFAEAALSLLRSYPALKLETLDMTVR